MQKALTVTVAVLMLGVAGCATVVYTHSTKNAQDFERDKYECEKVAEQSAANWGSPGNPFMIVEEMRKCLELRYGWTRTTATVPQAPAVSGSTTQPAGVWASLPAVARSSSAGINKNLARAVTMSNLAQVQSLLSQGADANTTSFTGPIIMQAATTGHADIVQALLEHGADANAKTTGGIPALTMAAMGHTEVVKVLIAHGADVNAKDDGQSQTALMMAAATGHIDIVKILFEHGAEVNAKSNFGVTALTMATMRGQADVAAFLRAHGGVATGLPGPLPTVAPPATAPAKK